MSVRVVDLDLGQPAHAAALLDLLEHYAQDPMGGGQGLSTVVHEQLIDALKAVAHYPRHWLSMARSRLG